MMTDEPPIPVEAGRHKEAAPPIAAWEECAHGKNARWACWRSRCNTKQGLCSNRDRCYQHSKDAGATPIPALDAFVS